MTTTQPKLGQMITEHIAPVMKAAGFGKKARHFYRETEDLQLQTISFLEFRLNHPHTHFYIDIGSDTYGRRVRVHGEPAKAPEEDFADMLEWRPRPGPAEGDRYWQLTPDLTLGPRIAHHLTDTWLPLLDKVTDLAWVEQQIRHLLATGDATWWPGQIVNPEVLLIYVIAAQRDDPEIDDIAATLPGSENWVHLVPRGRVTRDTL